jgi:hypothetical protein
MGAWGSGWFENDDAMDFLGDLAEDPRRVAVVLEQTMRRVVDAQGYVEVTDVSVAVAGAAVVAARLSGQLPTDPAVTDYVQQLDVEISDSLRDTALQVLVRALEEPDNEWFELWAEAGQIEEQREVLAELRRLLELPPPPRTPKRRRFRR